MDEQTKKDIYEIIEQAKILEALMKELESALTEKQKNNLASEEFFIDSGENHQDDYLHKEDLY